MSKRQYNINGSNYSDFNQNDLETIQRNNQEMLRNMQNRVLPEHKEKLNYDSMDRNLEVPHNHMYSNQMNTTIYQSNQQSNYPQHPQHQQYKQDYQNVSILDRALDVNQHSLPINFNGRLEYDNELNKKDTKNNNEQYKYTYIQNTNLFYGANGTFKQ